MLVYLDLNIFDRIEKLNELNESDRRPYFELENLILEKKVIVPYSNAHLNDLFRGFQKNPNYIDGHLQNIKRLTNNLCMCQYWGRNQVTWHIREIEDFFNEKKTEWEFEPTSFDNLLDFDDIDIPSPLSLYKLIPLPRNWKLGYQQDVMFGVMFPKSRVTPNMYSLMEDIYNFQNRIKSDFSLYKAFKGNLIRNINKLKSNRELLKTIKANNTDLPKHLDIFELSNLYSPKTKTSDNEDYSKILDMYFKYDLKGYKSDANFNNMFDDSLHTFYASHCDVFITNDERCKYKAEKTYERLNIKTKVLTANDIRHIRTCLKQ